MDAEQTQAAADRLAVKLDSLDLDTDERAVLGAILGAGASSVEPADQEVEGFAFDSYLWFKGKGSAGGDPGQSFTPGPKHETLTTLTFSEIQFTFTPRMFGK
jgi:hypothetical protein